MKFKFVLFLALSLSLLHAESEIRMRGIEDRVAKLEQKGAPKAAHHPITPCAGPKVRGGRDIHLSADFLFWTARLDGLTYAKTGFGSLVNSPSRGRVQAVDWSWDPGFKAGLGWSFCHGCWDMLLQYTWFYTNVDDSKKSESMVPGFQIFTPEDIPLSILPFQKGSAHFDLHYQVGDLELGRNYYVSKTLKLRPFVGAKGTWQKQDYNVFLDTIPITTNFFHFKTRIDHSLYGIGIRGGLNTSWQFSKNVSLYGNMALSGLWVHYNTNRKDTFTQIANGEQVGTSITTTNIEARLRLIKPVLEFAMGLRAETYYGCGRYHVLVQAGWESQIWLNQTLYISLNNNYDRFDLSLQGLTAKLRLDF
ncbi:Lpg1974 family pore-forming outer membrane protein [Candidatus Neptunochlamydia vexilliferae]|uniref:MOMP-like family protein n=1 Tax=Candidatus Neptunichlamydia vexilliferae TaxID=1651774 RepID=A0ABS0B0D9_9BACT|nr:Lpg1974 family pore-forming outer membrane protein [Candidatus Neptunochlamydia vexilliferae]MBF5059836.1 hypothetical protein [Candidatus Neptunochlamydia vexilliferae]